jgi:hypothetical protein
MRISAISILMLVLACSPGSSQDYHTAFGIKAGMAPGITAKHFLSTNGALEGIATFRWGGVNLTGLGEFHLPLFDTDGLNFYYGGGFHIGVWDTGKALDEAGGGQKLNLGIDGIVGIEYSFFDIPLSVGLDWKPNLNIIRDTRMIIDEISLVARYLLR